MDTQRLLERAKKGFAGRQKERKLIEQQLGRIRRGVPPEFAILALYGETNIGKTTLLHHYQDSTRADGFPSVLLDFDADWTHEPFDGETGYLQLLLKIGHGLADGQPLPFRSPAEADGLTPESVARQIVEYVLDIQAVRGNTPCVLLFDTVEQYIKENIEQYAKENKERFERLQAELFVPLVKTERVVIIVASRIELSWPRFEVRRLLKEHVLKPFSATETISQLSRGNKDAAGLARQVYRLTFGLPGSNHWVFRQIAELDLESAPVGDQLRVDQGLFRRLLEQEVLEFLLISKGTAQPLETEVQQALLWVSPLRSFSYSLLQKVMVAVNRDLYADKSPEHFFDLADRMEKTTYVQYSSERKGLAVTPAARSILHLYVQHLHETKHRTIHSTAAIWYEELVDQGNFFYAVEHLYHSAWLAKLNGKAETGILERCLAVLKAQVDLVTERASNKHDTLELILRELKRDDELRDLLPGNSLTPLIQVLKSGQEAGKKASGA